MYAWQVSALPSAPQPSEIDPYRFPGARDIDAQSALTPSDSSEDFLLLPLTRSSGFPSPLPPPTSAAWQCTPS